MPFSCCKNAQFPVISLNSCHCFPQVIAMSFKVLLQQKFVLAVRSKKRLKQDTESEGPFFIFLGIEGHRMASDATPP
jgi:hypothetical protein